MDPETQHRLASRAGRQLGLVTVAQLADLGITPAAQRRLVASGRLRRVGTRTRQIHGATWTPRARVLTACLDLDAVASHRTAAWLHGLHGFGCQIPAPVEVVVGERRQSTRSPLAAVRRTTNLSADDLTSVAPVPCVGIARTLLMLAGDLPRARTRDIVDAAVRDGLASDAWLWWRLERLRCQGRPGVANLEALLAERARLGPTESWLERRFIDLLASAGLPLPTVQRVVRRRGAFAARVDAGYEAHALVIELDGHAAHSTRAQREADAARQNQLHLAGQRVLRFTYDQVVRTPETVVATVTEALGHQGLRSGG